MKRIPLLLFLFIIPFFAHAQFEGGIRAGMNLSDWTTSANSYTKPGGSVGLTAEYTWNDRWNLQSGLSFTTKGIDGLAVMLGENTPATVDYRLYYLELPLMLRYRIPLTEQIGLLPGFGPYFACGVGGHADKNGINLPGDGSSRNPFKSEGDAFRALDRFDWGLAFAVTAQVYRWDLTLGYELGLYKNSIGPLAANDLRNRNLSITLGYRFRL